MQQRIVLFLVIAVAIISTAQVASIVGSTSPYATSTAMMWNFYISLFVCLSSLGGLTGHILRRRLHVKRLYASLFTSIRQAALIAIVLLLSLFFNTLGILQFWNIVPLIVAAVLIEFFFQAEKRPHAHIQYEKE